MAIKKDIPHTFQTTKVGIAFDNWLDNNQYKDKALGFKISENWAEIVGNTIYDHTSRIDVKLPKIFLRINNSSLKEMLYNDKQLMIDKVNTYLNSTAVNEIIFI
jgi:Dna[CI] antecedent, DciA